MANSENSDSPQIKLFHECGRAFHTRDPVLLARTTHKDYRYVTHPQSLGHPEQTKEEWLEQWREVMSFLTADSVSTHRFIIDTPGKLVVHTTFKAKTSIGVESTRESIIIAHIVTDEDGSLKMKRTEEFTDSNSELNFVQAITVAAAKKQQCPSCV